MMKFIVSCVSEEELRNLILNDLNSFENFSQLISSFIVSFSNFSKTGKSANS
jgi:hypothetical protein